MTRRISVNRTARQTQRNGSLVLADLLQQHYESVDLVWQHRNCQGELRQALKLGQPPMPWTCPHCLEIVDPAEIESDIEFQIDHDTSS
jgi:hypothetical protein